LWSEMPAGDFALGLPSSLEGRGLIMGYGRTPITPGRYLEDSLRNLGVRVDVSETEVDFAEVDPRACAAVLFVESPSRPQVKVKNIHLASVPRLFWVHHGVNRWQDNLGLCGRYRPDLMLLSGVLYLASLFPVPVHFFPFAAASWIFNSSKPLAGRGHDISFAGTVRSHLYATRLETLRATEARFKARFKLSLRSNVYLEDLATLYGDSKIVVNCSADLFGHGLNLRVFEAMACGALLVTDKVLDFEKLFRDGEHCVVYDDIPDLLDKLEHYLTHLDEAQAIASRGHEVVLEKHTYADRAREVLGLIARVADERALGNTAR